MSDAVSLITGIGGAITNPISTLINNYHNEQLVREQNRLNYEQWNRENEYNLPVNQMARLRAAGLNPNLMYANGASSLLSAPSPSMDSARSVAPQVDPLTLAQISNLNADTAQKKAGAENLGAQTDNLDAQTWLQNFQNLIINSNESEVKTLAYNQIRALNLSSLSEFYESAYSACVLASIFDGFYNNDLGNPELLSSNGFQISPQLLTKFEGLGLSKMEQERLEYALYSSYYRAQEKINRKSGEEADMESVIPSMINSCPKWLQPILIAAWTLFKGSTLPSVSFKHSSESSTFKLKKK